MPKLNLPELKIPKRSRRRTRKRKPKAGATRYLKVLAPAALIVIVVTAGFEVPTTIPQPTPDSVSGKIKLTAKIKYAVFSGGCSYNETAQEKTLPTGELIGIASKTYNASTAVSEIEWLCKLIVSEVNHYNYYLSLSNEGVDVSIILSELEYLLSLNGPALCSMITRYGGSCSQGFPPLLPIFSVSIPLSVTDVGYVVSARVALSNQLPLTIERIAANESNGRSLNVRFNETSCAKDCSFPITLASGHYYSASAIQSTGPIRIVLSMSVESAEIWGCPYWWIRIGIIQKTIVATLEIIPSNSTMRLLA